jgi:hypothetical protein
VEQGIHRKDPGYHRTIPRFHPESKGTKDFIIIHFIKKEKRKQINIDKRFYCIYFKKERISV